MRVIFMGTPDFAVPCLQRLIDRNNEILAVFTQPDKPKGRGKKMTMPPVKELAVEKDIPVYQPAKLKTPEMTELIREMKPDIIIVVAYGHLLSKEILDIPPFGCVNVHASLLPAYRGSAPIHWAIINGEKVTGNTTMYMDVGMDTGDMILKEELEIGENETTGELHDRLSMMGAELLMKTLTLIEKGEVEREKQNEEEATYAPMMSKEVGKIQWEKSATEIRNLIRGTNPWPSAFTAYGDKVMKIWRARVESSEKIYQPGKIIKVNKEEVFVGTGKDILVIQELQFSGGKRLAVKDFLVGNSIVEDIILGEDSNN
ncbi:methionyl-tRNA formyltransferase [Alkaliphilus hydrothermalis]|uniref:Methionyl-tRNA formyltransferase n=1 Tax=Alkaliphilus hydrothermalis TaxID=1482730 RepID=A0ABS2NNI9_9FIRM|nr:methionyl-tRNA formyltransferase [Alkaliphilus hydrothermalis]MBM7614512.1 methionyl-tRNA formyltransferase [Alkaliphilus hydrothermalis]